MMFDKLILNNCDDLAIMIKMNLLFQLIYMHVLDQIYSSKILKELIFCYFFF